MRMLKAVSLLRESAAKVINVAEHCGFNHLGLFNKCFKRRFGASPGQWRTLAARAHTATTVNVGNLSLCPLHSNGLCPMLGGPSVSGSSSPQRSQLKTAVLSAVLAKPVEQRNGEQARPMLEAQLGGRPEPSNNTPAHASA